MTARNAAAMMLRKSEISDKTVYSDASGRNLSFPSTCEKFVFVHLSTRMRVLFRCLCPVRGEGSSWVTEDRCQPLWRASKPWNGRKKNTLSQFKSSPFFSGHSLLLSARNLRNNSYFNYSSLHSLLLLRWEFFHFWPQPLRSPGTGVGQGRRAQKPSNGRLLTFTHP